MTPARAGLFSLAEHLHMTVSQLSCALTVTEYLEWCRYLRDKAQPEGAAPDVLDLDNATHEDLARMFGK